MADKPLPECRVKARSASANREHRIHGHAVAGAGIAGVCFLRPVLEGEGLAGEGVVVTRAVTVRGAGGLVHPAFFPDQTNLAFPRNARLGLWIRVSNAVCERGQGSVERDLAIVAEPAARPAAHVLHTAIHRLPAPAR